MRGKKTLAVTLIVSLLVLLAAGCSFKSISHGTEINEDQVAKIHDGKTTKEEIFIEVGNPTKTMDNEKVFFYTWTRGSKSSVLMFGGGSAYTHSLVIVFDDKGVVKSHKITRGDTPQATGIGD